jgi:cyclohexa-1,5-dienecarbonyl-CoA hydratase
MREVGANPVRVQEIEQGRILRVVIEHGKGNVIDRELIAELRETLAQAARRPALRALVLDHAGPNASYGAKIAEHAPLVVERFLPEFHALARALVELPACSVAAVRGLCLGGGWEVAALADLVFAAPGTCFGQPETKLGVFAPIGSALLPRLAGPRRAAEWLLSGRNVPAEEARAAGLVAEIAEDPSVAALAFARDHLLPKSGRALGIAARAARRAWATPFLADLAELERLYLDELMSTHDAREGIAAFLEKRPPRWEDR